MHILLCNKHSEAAYGVNIYKAGSARPWAIAPFIRLDFDEASFVNRPITWVNFDWIHKSHRSQRAYKPYLVRGGGGDEQGSFSTSQELYKLSRWLSYALRHGVQPLQLRINASGYTPLQDLQWHKPTLTENLLRDIVRTDKKQRFHIDDAPDGSLLVKAVAGHTAGVMVKPSLPKLHELPRQLVHGTRATCMPGITAQGLDSRKREHIHFVDASDRTSVENQLRQSSTVFIYIRSKTLNDHNIPIYRAENGVYLVQDTIMPELFDSVEWKDPDQADLQNEQAELEQPLGTRNRSRSPPCAPPSASARPPLPLNLSPAAATSSNRVRSPLPRRRRSFWVPSDDCMVEPPPVLHIPPLMRLKTPFLAKPLGYGDGDQQVATGKDAVHPLAPVKHSKSRSSKPSVYTCSTEQSFASTRAATAQAHPEDAACNFGATQALVTELLSQLHEARSKNRKLRRKLRQKRATIKQLTLQVKTSRPVLQRHRQSQEVTPARPPLPRKRHCQGGETMLARSSFASICIYLYLLFDDVLRSFSFYPSDTVNGIKLLPVSIEILHDCLVRDLTSLIRLCELHIWAFCHSWCGYLASLLPANIEFGFVHRPIQFQHCTLSPLLDPTFACFCLPDRLVFGMILIASLSLFDGLHQHAPHLPRRPLFQCSGPNIVCRTHWPPRWRPGAIPIDLMELRPFNDPILQLAPLTKFLTFNRLATVSHEEIAQLTGVDSSTCLKLKDAAGKMGFHQDLQLRGAIFDLQACCYSRQTSSLSPVSRPEYRWQLSSGNPSRRHSRPLTTTWH